MKKFIGFFLLVSSLAIAGTVPKNQNGKKLEASTGEIQEDGLLQGPISTKDMNPSPNPAPASESEVIENSTLTNQPAVKTGPFDDGKIPGRNEIQAQEDAMDYSTTPEKRPKKKTHQAPKKTNKIQD